VTPAATDLSGPISVVGDNIIPLFSGRAGDERDDRFGVAHVKDFVRHARFDVNEIAGFIFQHFSAAIAEFVPHFSFDDVKDYFEIDVDVRAGDADVRRQLFRADIFRRHALFVMNAIPIPARTAAANGQDAIVIFDRAELDLVVAFHH